MSGILHVWAISFKQHKGGCGIITPLCYKFFEKGVCLRNFPLWKIVGPPWKEGEIRLGVDKYMFSKFGTQKDVTLVWPFDDWIGCFQIPTSSNIIAIQLIYSEDLNNRNVWLTNSNFYLSGMRLQYSDHHANTGLVFKWWWENQTKYSPVLVKWILDHSVIRQFAPIWISD